MCHFAVVKEGADSAEGRLIILANKFVVHSVVAKEGCKLFFHHKCLIISGKMVMVKGERKNAKTLFHVAKKGI